MLGFTLLLAAVLATGTGAARWLYGKFESERPSPLEMLVAGAVFGLGLWVAASWALALTHSLTRPALWGVVAAFAVAGIALLARGRFGALPKPARAGVLVLLPIAAWTAFILWRGAVVPPVNHDALSYHLPKSVLIARAGAFPQFENFDHRFPSFPANYELLVADLMILSRSDGISEWIGTTFYLLFLLASALLVQRWWGPGIHVGAAVMATAAAPVVLLHSGADKNDLMTHFFTLTTLYWGARWAVRGGVVPMALLVTSIGLAVGTKTNAGAIAIGLLPFVAVRVIREGVRIRPAMATMLYGAAAFALCGGAVFILAVTSHQLMGVEIGGRSIGKPLYVYRSWSHLWEVPFQMFAAGISGNDDTRYVLFSTHFGPMITVLAVFLPFAVWRYRAADEKPLARERIVLSLAAALAFVVMLPTNIHPPAMPRYALFLLPVIVAWTIAPAIRELVAGNRLRRYALVLIGGLAAVFFWQAVDAALHDACCPLRFALWCARHPGTREAPRLHEHASMVADRLAGPDDTVAFYGDRSSWIHPAFGAHLSRPLVMLPEDATAASIPPAAEWVVMERWWIRPQAAESHLYDELLRDPRFRLVFHNAAFNHSVFRRVGR